MDLTTYTDSDIDELRVQILTEQERRRLVADAPAQAVALADRYAAAIGRQDGDPWQQPAGAHDAFRLDAIVTHGDKTWRSKHHANVWPPSSSSRWWEEVTDIPGPQPWALDTYYSVDTRVTFGGQTWRCRHEHLAQVGWEPGAPGMHAVWL